MTYSPSHILELNRAAFRQEAEDLLSELDGALLQLEASPNDRDCVHRAFRVAHTLKGSGASAGFDQVAALVHGLEDLFNDAREGRVVISSQMVDVALKLADIVRNLIGVVPGSGVAAFDQGRKLVDELNAVRKSAQPLSASGQESEKQLWWIRFEPQPGILHTGNDPLLLMRELLAIGHGRVHANTDRLFAAPDFDPELCYLSWEILLLTDKGRQSISDVFAFVEDAAELRIEPVAPELAWVLPSEAYFEPSVIKDFHEEVQEDMSELEAQLLAFEDQTRDSQSLDAAKRILHNIKGLCGLLLSDVRYPPPERHPVRAISELCHAAEGFLSPYAVQSGRSIDDSKFGLLLETVDGLRSLLHAFDEARELWPGDLLSRLSTDDAEPASSATRASGRTVSLRPQKQPTQCPEPVRAGPAATTASAATQRSVRVDYAKLDRLMRAVGELLVVNNSLPVLAAHAWALDCPPLAKEIKETGELLAHIADDLQDAMRQVQMTPIRSVFQRFPRLIRDLSHTQGKQIQLIIAGEETELDRTILERIADPLVHLVRNAVDHGIEMPDVRSAAGKSPVGTVGLEVLKEGSYITLRISDDGRGIDPQKLRAKAVEKGLLSENEAHALSDEGALDLIFLPGFSTAEKVTDISGRGVGMDVVQSNIRDLHGTINVASEVGRGTVLSLKLPASLMVSKGILFECANEHYLLPIEAVREMVKIQSEQVHDFQGMSSVSVRGTVYPIFWLARLLGFVSAPQSSEPTNTQEEVNTAIVSTRTGEVALVVDRFVSEIDVIAKPLAEGLDPLRVFQGATILGDGSVALILEPNRLDALVASQRERRDATLPSSALAAASCVRTDDVIATA